MAGTFCVYEAPDEETVRRACAGARRARVLIQEIVGDVTPDDFPLDGEGAPAQASN